MFMEPVPYRSFEVVHKPYKLKVCREGWDIVKHTKMMPECRNVTKQNCITKWDTDENGKQVWAGNEGCEPVTWKECKLVPKQVDFKVPNIICENSEDSPTPASLAPKSSYSQPPVTSSPSTASITYDDYMDIEKTQMTSNMVCEVKHTSSCNPNLINKCERIKYQVG